MVAPNTIVIDRFISPIFVCFSAFRLSAFTVTLEREGEKRELHVPRELQVKSKSQLSQFSFCSVLPITFEGYQMLSLKLWQFGVDSHESTALQMKLNNNFWIVFNSFWSLLLVSFSL